jgi:hypothetical protein
MIDGGAHDRQTERHVDRVAESRVLEHGQPLVVVHREHDIVVRQMARHEHRIRGQRAVHEHPRAARALDRGRDDVGVFAAEMAAFPGVRVEPARGDARARDAPEPAHVVVEDAERGVEQIGRDRIADGAQRQVGRRERDAQGAGGEQHDGMRRAGALREIFGVAGERHAGIVDHALLHGRGDDGGELAAHGARDRAVEQREHVRRIRRIERACDAGRCQGDVEHAQPVGSGGFRVIGGVGNQLDPQTEHARALDQQCTRADDDERAGKRRQSESEAEVRTDAGGFTRGDRDCPPGGLQSLNSTYASSRSRRSQSSVSSSTFAARNARNAC